MEAHRELFLRGIKNINKKIMDTKIVAAAKWSVITEVLGKAYYTTYKYNIGPYACADGVWYISNNYDGYLFCRNALLTRDSKSFL